MSKIGKKAVSIPRGVTVTIRESDVSVKGPKGELGLALGPTLRAEVKGEEVYLTSSDSTRAGSSMYGLMRSLLANMVLGVAKGYTRELELQGVGFRAAVQGNRLALSLGFASPVEFIPPEGIKVTVKDNIITLEGADKQKIGDAAARIRSLYPPEPYKGKGIRYVGEYVRRKAGKTVA